MKFAPRLPAWLLLLLLPQTALAIDAAQLLQGEIRSGLAVVVADDISLASELAAGGDFVVHLLTQSGERISLLRKQVAERQLGGRVVVAPLPEGYLPHPDRFVNLLIADLDALGEKALPPGEVRRVLALRGQAHCRQAGEWQTLAPLPADRLDGWSHRWYDATGNCVSQDRVAGFPRSVQWQHGPALEDGTSDGKVPRVAAGRWLAVDNASGDVVCRDAGNGALLWRAESRLAPGEDLAVVDDRVYLFHRPQEELGGKPSQAVSLAALDLATGNLAQTYDQGLRYGTAQPIEYTERNPQPRTRRQTPVPWFVVTADTVLQAYAGELVALDRNSGKRRWQKQLNGATWFSPAVSDGVVLAVEAVNPARRARHDGTSHARALAAFSLKTGEPLWRNTEVHPERPVEEKGVPYFSRAEFKPLSVAGGLILTHVSSYQFRQGGSIAVLRLADGKELWRREFASKQLYTQGSQRAVLRGAEAILLDGTGAYRFDAQTGKPLAEPIRNTGIRRLARANGACTASRATLDWLICNAYLYVGPDGKPQPCYGARGACGEGVVPAAGLIYVAPTPCDCGDYTRGYQALAPSVAGRAVKTADRLIAGEPAAANQRQQSAEQSTDAWPTFLGDPSRRSATQGALPAELRPVWSAQLAQPKADRVDGDRRQSERYLGALSAPVADGDLVLVALPETHQVAAVSAMTGQVRWRFTTGGKVDSPPTLAHGLALFGCDDGFVYAVHQASGKLAWRFFAAPTDAVAMRHGHLASAFPLPGSVLVMGRRAIVCSGHHTDVGGLHFWSLDLLTGRPLAERVIRSDQPTVVTNGVAVADLTGEGCWIGRQLHLSLDLKDLPAEQENQPVVWIDRNGDRLRFRDNEHRGGSTHGWKGALRSGRLTGHRLAYAGPLAYALRDPTAGDRHVVRAEKTPLVVAADPTLDRKTQTRWATSIGALGSRESYSSLILAGDKLYLAGGARDGSSGFVQVLAADSGKLRTTHTLPTRVTECGLAAAANRLFVSCEDGTLHALGK